MWETLKIVYCEKIALSLYDLIIACPFLSWNSLKSSKRNIFPWRRWRRSRNTEEGKEMFTFIALPNGSVGFCSFFCIKTDYYWERTDSFFCWKISAYHKIFSHGIEEFLINPKRSKRFWFLSWIDLFMIAFFCSFCFHYLWLSCWKFLKSKIFEKVNSILLEWNEKLWGSIFEYS